jgi:hypothetical protein
MKALSFIFNNLQYLHGEMRMKFMRDLILRDYFFRFFLHWSDEVRGFFHRIIVFKVFRSSRRTLPCQTDDELLNSSVFTRSDSTVELPASLTLKLTKGKDRRGSKDAKPPPAPSSPKSKAPDLADRPRTHSTMEAKDLRMTSLDPKFLDHEQTALDLVLVSKVDAYIRLVVEQVSDPSIKNFDPLLFPYAHKSLREYTAVLRSYYDSPEPQAVTLAEPPVSDGNLNEIICVFVHIIMFHELNFFLLTPLSCDSCLGKRRS